MTADLERADRAAAVRDAARAWHRAGLVDAAALAAVESAWPDDRVRVGPVFRTLLFAFTLAAAIGIAAFFAIQTSHIGTATVAAAAGIACLALTEIQIGPLRRRQGGTEAATSVAGIGLLVFAAALFLGELGPRELESALPMLVLAATLTGIAAWRWGYPLAAAAAAAATLAAVARAPAGRAGWIVLCLLAAPPLLRLSASPRLPPAHRSSATAMLLVALAALYLAVNVAAYDHRLVEWLGGRAPKPHVTAAGAGAAATESAGSTGSARHAGPDGNAESAESARNAGPVGSARSAGSAGTTAGHAARWAAVAATALLPILLLAVGARRRRLPLLLAGIVTAAASVATARLYHHLGPTWLVLTVAGALSVAAVLVLWRFLEAGPGGERYGFTAAPLAGDGRGQGAFAVLAVGLTTLTVRPDAHGPAGGEDRTAPTDRFGGGGGRSGGGGASGEF